eukprot:jgi/Ulvmu1/12258/UM086_0051.1
MNSRAYSLLPFRYGASKHVQAHGTNPMQKDRCASFESPAAVPTCEHTRRAPVFDVGRHTPERASGAKCVSSSVLCEYVASVGFCGERTWPQNKPDVGPVPV